MKNARRHAELSNFPIACSIVAAAAARGASPVALLTGCGMIANK
jgi:hypothetical protein